MPELFWGGRLSMFSWAGSTLAQYTVLLKIWWKNGPSRQRNAQEICEEGGRWPARCIASLYLLGGGGGDFVKSCIDICKELNSKLPTAGKTAVRPSLIHGVGFLILIYRSNLDNSKEKKKLPSDGSCCASRQCGQRKLQGTSAWWPFPEDLTVRFNLNRMVAAS